MIVSRAVNETGQWAEAVAPLRRALEAGQEVHPRRELRGLYALAESLGAKLLAKYRQLDEDGRRDLVQELLSRRDKLRAIVSAENPRAYFIQCVTRAAIDALRRQETRANPVEPQVLDAEPGAEGDRDFMLDARAAFEALAPRTREILVAVHSGVKPEEVAAHFSMSREAVYQVVSRTKSAWKRRGCP
jgi:RNA polymerase sigma factor (sigma-70 family)